MPFGFRHMMYTDPQGSEMEQQTINQLYTGQKSFVICRRQATKQKELCAKFPPNILSYREKCTQKRHNCSISDFKVVPNYLCCFCPNILGTLFTSPQIIFLHNLLEQLVSFSSNIPSFNRCRSATEMKGKLARRERKEVRTSFRHFGALLEPRFHSQKLEWLPSF